MGWAPFIFLFTGLWIDTNRADLFLISWPLALFGFLLLLLLDNGPSSNFWIPHWLQHFATDTRLCTTGTSLLADRSCPLRQPRSRSQLRGLCTFGLLVGFLIMAWHFSTQSTARGEGYVTTMGDMGADLTNDFSDTWFSAKRHGWEPQKIYESYQTGKNREICKRSYKRALNRASIHGVTWYKGRLYTAHQLGVKFIFQHDVKPPPNVSPPKAVQRRRLTCLSWNCNGMPPAHWDLLQMWLDSQCVDVLLLQETHWPFTRDWDSANYMMVHSGTQTKQAGLLCMISKKLCNPSDLSWQEIIPGRVLHLRIHGQSRCIDIINVYQYTCIPSHMDSREHVWHQLFALLSSLSQRNVLLMAGDFNCSAVQRTDAVGYPTFAKDGARCHGPRHVDAHHWKQLLSQFDLMALNTWNAGDGPTYEFCSQSSRIDYICTRRAHADQPARDVKQLRDFDLVPITGAYHIPLMTTIRRDWFPASSPIKIGWTRQQRLQLHQHCSKQDHVFDMFQAQVIDAVQNLEAQDHSDLYALHDTLNRFPSTPFQQDQSHKLHRLDMGLFRRFQEHTKKLRRMRSTDLAGLFSAWYHVSCRSKARQTMTLTSKASRKPGSTRSTMQRPELTRPRTTSHCSRPSDPLHASKFKSVSCWDRTRGSCWALKQLLTGFINGSLICTQWVTSTSLWTLLIGHFQLMTSYMDFVHCPHTRLWHHSSLRLPSGSMGLRSSHNILTRCFMIAALYPVFQIFGVWAAWLCLSNRANEASILRNFAPLPCWSLLERRF